MLMRSRQRLYSITNPPFPVINSSNVSRVFTDKSVGVLIAETPNWGSHLDKMMEKKIARYVA